MPVTIVQLAGSNGLVLEIFMRLQICLSAITLALFSASAMAQQGPAAMFDRMDANGDDAVSMDEVRAWRTTFFENADADANGFITREEVEAMQARAREQAEARGRRGRGPRGGGDPIARHDSDGDGQVSRAEFIDAPFPALERFDANGDGLLSRDELPRRARRG